MDRRFWHTSSHKPQTNWRNKSSRRHTTDLTDEPASNTAFPFHTNKRHHYKNNKNNHFFQQQQQQQQKQQHQLTTTTDSLTTNKIKSYASVAALQVSPPVCNTSVNNNDANVSSKISCNVITSYGVIAACWFPTCMQQQQYENDDDDDVCDGEWKYLMVRRKDSFGYIDFVRGKYFVEKRCEILKAIDQMTMQEKQRILRGGCSGNAVIASNHFHQLWLGLWGGNPEGMRFKTEYAIAKKKYVHLCTTGILVSLINQHSTTRWQETEWEFPKGHREQNGESPIECATREFKEETLLDPIHIQWVHLPHYEQEEGKEEKDNNTIDDVGLLLTDLTLEVNNDAIDDVNKEEIVTAVDLSVSITESVPMKPKATSADTIVMMREEFIGSNFKRYCYQYYVGIIPHTHSTLLTADNTTDLSLITNGGEISKLEWKTKTECLTSIRPYHTEKQDLICKLDDLFTKVKAP